MTDKEKLELAEMLLKTVSECPHCRLCAESAKQYFDNFDLYDSSPELTRKQSTG